MTCYPLMYCHSNKNAKDELKITCRTVSHTCALGISSAISIATIDSKRWLLNVRGCHVREPVPVPMSKTF